MTSLNFGNLEKYELEKLIVIFQGIIKSKLSEENTHYFMATILKKVNHKIYYIEINKFKCKSKIFHVMIFIYKVNFMGSYTGAM